MNKGTKIAKGTKIVKGTKIALVAMSIVVCALVAGPDTAAQAPVTTTATAAVAPQAVLDKYCVTCHSTRTRAGGLTLEKLNVAAAASDPQTWEKVIRKVETGMMPPSGA